MISKRKETEEKAKKEAELQAKEQAKREAEEAKKRKEAEKRAKKEAEVQDQKIDSDIYEGSVQIVIPSPVRFEQVEQFKECLEGIGNLAILWTGGSVDEGSMIGVLVQKPMALIRNLNEIPTVNNVYKKGKKIVVILSTTSGD